MMSPAAAQRQISRAHRHHAAGRLGIALGIYAKVLRAQPLNAAALHYCALLTRQLNQQAKAAGHPTRDDEAMRLMALSVARAPENPAAIHNFAKFLDDSGDLDGARQLYTRAVAINPNQGESWTNLGNVFGKLGDRERAEACWDCGLECPTGSADARFNLSFLKLLRGQYPEGWHQYEARWQTPEFLSGYGRPDLDGDRWDGSRVLGTLYVHGEQGAGDVLMMARYLPLVRARAEHVAVEVLPSLERLFRAAYRWATIVRRGDPVPPHAAQIPMMSLPSVFGTTLETIPPPACFSLSEAA